MRNWLQRTAPAPNRPDPRRGYWRHTKLELVHQLRSTSTRTRGVTGVKPSVNNIVKEMDPDVVARSTRVGVPTVLEPKDAVRDLVGSHLCSLWRRCVYFVRSSRKVFLNHFSIIFALESLIKLCRSAVRWTSHGEVQRFVGRRHSAGTSWVRLCCTPCSGIPQLRCCSSSRQCRERELCNG